VKPGQSTGGGKADHDGQQHHAENVIKNGCAQDDLGGRVASTCKSPGTRAVIPTLVATIAAPTKIASVVASPRNFM